MHGAGQRSMLLKDKTMEGMTHRRRSTTLAELVNVAVFMASDRAGAMTGAANLTGGRIVD